MRNPLCGPALLLASLFVAPASALAAEADRDIPSRADPALVRFVQSVVESNPRVQAAQSALNASDSLRDAASRLRRGI